MVIGQVFRALVNVTTVSLDDSLDPRPEPGADGPDEALLHVVPLLGNGVLEGVNVWVLLSTSLPLNIRPYGEIQRIEIWRARWPNLLRPEFDVVGQPFLNSLSSMTGSAILHEDEVVAVREVLLDPRKDMGDQDAVQVLLSTHPEARLKKDQRHFLAV